MSFTRSLVIKERRLAAVCNPYSAKAFLAGWSNSRAIRCVAKAMASAMFGYCVLFEK
jgi:hypothetical protein